MLRSPSLLLFSMRLVPTRSARGWACFAFWQIANVASFRSGVPAAGHRQPPPRRNDRVNNSRSARNRPLKATFVVAIAGIGLVATSAVAVGHHSVAMFDREHPVELVGVVREFKFINPHAFIALEVTGKDARPVIWNLEGDSPNSLKWDGWSNQTLKPGDELRLTIEPLRSGAPGGVWHARKTTYKDGTPIAVVREK
jgi:Family of unknown function (DUF6152)